MTDRVFVLKNEIAAYFWTKNKDLSDKGERAVKRKREILIWYKFYAA